MKVRIHELVVADCDLVPVTRLLEERAEIERRVEHARQALVAPGCAADVGEVAERKHSLRDSRLVRLARAQDPLRRRSVVADGWHESASLAEGRAREGVAALFKKISSHQCSQHSGNPGGGTHDELPLVALELDPSTSPRHAAPRLWCHELALHRFRHLTLVVLGARSFDGVDALRALGREQLEELVRGRVQSHAVAEKVRAEKVQVVLLLLGRRRTGEGGRRSREDQRGEARVAERSRAVKVPVEEF